MPAVPEPADRDVLAMLSEQMRTVERHRPLYDAAVRVNVLMMDGDGDHGVKSHGHPAAACVRVLNLKQRLTTGYDAEVEICRLWWANTPDERAGLLDHELCHIALKKFTYRAVLDAAGEPTGDLQIKCDRDRLGRPKLRTVKGDVNVGDAFADVIARHGDKAPEVTSSKQFAAFVERAMGSVADEPSATLPINRKWGG